MFWRDYIDQALELLSDIRRLLAEISAQLKERDRVG